jgi:hypothetical protein
MRSIAAGFSRRTRPSLEAANGGTQRRPVTEVGTLHAQRISMAKKAHWTIRKNDLEQMTSLRRILRAAPWLSLFMCGACDSSGLSAVDTHDASAAQEARDAEAASKPSAPLANQELGRGAGCDLRGRWIMTEHQSSTVLGSNQVTINWFYVELAQQGDQVTMTTGMSCGRITRGLPAIEVEIDDSPAWPAYSMQVRYDGRKGTSLALDNECHLSFERAVLVRGATVSRYRDLSAPLPELEQRAGDDTPGWEDWDDDGHPGVTMRVSGTLSGSIYEDNRTWSEYDGIAPRDAGSFMLGHNWQQERVTLGYDDSPVLVYEGVRDTNEAQHAVELTRLLPDQATGDDAAKCQSIRKLAPTLTPNANAEVLR